jgi:DNA-binding transcriptional LysR family regulator
VDLIAENYDAAIGGGFDLAPDLVSRTLAPVHVVAVASPAYMSGRSPPADPSVLAGYNGIVMRSLHTGRIRHWMLRNVNGMEMAGTLTETIVVNDPAAMREATRLGLGVSLIALFDVLPELERKDLIRLLPNWYADAGRITDAHCGQDTCFCRFRRQCLQERAVRALQSVAETNSTA